MILRFKNLGIIKEADIDLSKPFIVFTGPNGTGKTYLSYVIADLPRSLGGYFLTLSRKKEERPKLAAVYDPYQFEHGDEVKGELNPEILYDFFKKGISYISVGLLRSLNLKEDEDNPFSIEVVSTYDEWKIELYKMKLECGFFLELHKEFNSFEYKVTALPEFRNRDKENNDYDFEQALFFNSIFFHGASTATMFTAERSGIALFSKELAVGRLKAERTSIPRYPIAISKSLGDAEDRAHYGQHKGAFSVFADLIEESILKGKVKVTNDGELRLIRGSNSYDLAITSSTMKAIADIVFYIRYRAQKMSRLLIDEPEINLHPNNQLILTRVFSQMVNRGLQLVISTHSDYIIREINNMIMAESLRRKYNSLEEIEKLGYIKDELLKMSDVAAYYFAPQSDGKVSVEELVVNSYGFDVQSINSVIESQNSITNDLFDRLTYETDGDGDE